jgi:hypothetical protein
MFKDIFKSMSGIEVYGIISLILFFLIFLGVIYWSIKVDKKYLNKMKQLPLDSSNSNGDLNHG